MRGGGRELYSRVRVDLVGGGRWVAGGVAGLVRGFDHHLYGLEGGVHVDGVPLDAVSLEVVLVEALVVVLAVEVSFETVGEPPGTGVVLGTRVVVSGGITRVGWVRGYIRIVRFEPPKSRRYWQ